MTKTASQKARRAAIASASRALVADGAQAVANQRAQDLVAAARLLRRRQPGMGDTIVRGPEPVTDGGVNPVRRKAPLSRRPAEPMAMVGASKELRAFDGYAGQSAEARRVIASQYLAQLVDVDSPEYNVGLPDGIGMQTVVTTAYQELPAVTAERADGSQWSGLALFPALSQEQTSAGNKMTLFQLTAVDESGVITWSPVLWTNTVLDSVLASASAWRPVTHSMKLMDESAAQVLGGYAFVGTFQILSPSSGGAVLQGAPASLSDIVDNPQNYQRVNLKDSERLHEVTVGFMPNLTATDGATTSRATVFQALPPNGPSFAGEQGLVYLARVPTVSASPGEYTVRTWNVRRVVEWIPSEVTGALGSEDTSTPTDARQELSDLKQYVLAKTGVSLANTRGMRSQNFITDAWRSATRIVSDIAKTVTTVIKVGNAAAEGIRSAIGVGSEIAGIVGVLGSRGSHSRRYMSVTSPHSAAALAQHYSAVASGETSLVVARFWAGRLGDPRYDQRMAQRAADLLEAGAVPDLVSPRGRIPARPAPRVKDVDAGSVADSEDYAEARPPRNPSLRK